MTRSTAGARLLAAVPWLLLVLGLGRIVLALTFSQSPDGVRTGNEFVDLGVYRMGGRAVLDGLPLYDQVFAPYGLPFTYPPFAALLFVPFALVPVGVAQALMVLLGLAALGVSAWIVAQHLPTVLGAVLPWSPRVTAIGLFGLGGMLEPTTTTLDLGQVNLVLMAAVLIDTFILVRASGLLVGIAAGVKIVPGIFALVMLPERRWRAFRNACIGFGVTVVLGVLVQPAESLRYWTRLFYDDTRQASVVTILNQSLYADCVRLVGRSSGLVLWAVVAGVVLVVGLRIAVRLWPEDRLTSTTTVAVVGLLVSPVTWNHHWVWLMPAFATAAAVGVRAWRAGRRGLGFASVAFVLAFTATTAIGPIKLADVSQSFTPSLVGWLVGNSLVAAGVGYLLIVGAASWLLPVGPPDAVPVRAERPAP